MGRTAAGVAILCAFACGLLVGAASVRERRGRRPAGSVSDPSRVLSETRAAPEAGEPAAPDHGEAQPSTRVAAADRPQYLDPGADFREWDREELARWYEVHREAWELPALSPEQLEAVAPVVLSLGRIPRRAVLMRILAATAALEEDMARVVADFKAWAEAHPNAPRDHPERLAHLERLRATQQEYFDRLHASLAYSDYALIFVRQGDRMMDGLVERAPGGGRRPPGADPYARPVAVVREPYVFCAWYHAYGPELGLPARERDFVWGFCENVARPLGRAPDAALMARLVAAYDPYHAAAVDGRDDDPEAQRALLERLRAVLSPLDFRRVLHSRRWQDAAAELGVAPR